LTGTDGEPSWARSLIRSPRARLWALLAPANAFALALPAFVPLKLTVLPAFLGGQFPFLSVCLVATLTFHVLTLPSRVWRVLVPVALLAELPSFLGPWRPAWYPPFGCGFALAATLLRCALALRTEGPERQLHWRALFDALVPPGLFAATIALLGLASYLTPVTRDLEIQRIGAALGPWPPIVVARWFASSSVLRLACQLVYMLLPVQLAFVHGLSFRARPRAHPTLLLSFVLLPLLAYPLYVAVPLVGPRETWSYLDATLAFPPAAPPTVHALILKPAQLVARNCMPSLHTAWALAAWFQARRLSRALSIFTALWFAGTELATLGLGEHWLIDLIVAVPFTCLVFALADGAARDPRRRPALLLQGALVCAWIVVLRSYSGALAGQPLLVQLAMLATPFVALAGARKLWAEQEPSAAGAPVGGPGVGLGPLDTEPSRSAR
jgi:hypothetical protein